MAYNQKLADRIREKLSNLSHIQEKEMMGGLVFMYNNKMCIGVVKDEMMCRIDPDLHEAAVEKTGCRTMDFTGRPMKGYVLIDEQGMHSEKDFEYWINTCLDYNSKAKASKKKKRTD
jgi:TfoX/Sxy family transcriptional regulator of competence genes